MKLFFCYTDMSRNHCCTIITCALSATCCCEERPYIAPQIWKNSAWVGVSIMIDREIPLAKLAGQVLLSMNTDILTQPRSSSVYKVDLTKLAR